MATEDVRVQKKGKITQNQKKGRLIVRNLSFKANEESVKEAFQRFGVVTEVSIPKKPDGKMFGFGFVQFESMTAALKARKAMNLQPLLGRPIAVDISISKDRYAQLKGNVDTTKEEITVPSSDPTPVSTKRKRQPGKGEQDKNDDLVVDDEFLEVDESDDNPGSGEEDSDGEVGDDSADSSMDEDADDGPNNDSGEESEGDAESDEENGSDGEEDEDDDDEDEDSQPSKKRKIAKDDDRLTKNKPERKSDVGEGKTLFIRNLSFDTDNESLQSCFGEFGQLDYAVVCVDRDTDHSKGTAFVKFKEKDCAMNCLETAAKDDGLLLDGQKIIVNIAISRDEIKKRAEEKIKKAKDNRNLALAREGLIRPGTQAAVEVSKKDLDQRTALDVWKRKMLANNHMFISNTRLCIRNLPPNFQDDKKLGNIFLKAGGNGAKITEARIIRNLKTVGEDGIGISKGFGYVTFTEHKHALQALRNTNNNPNIFSKKSRPIVDFSIENKAALNVKQKRLEKSLAKSKELAQEMISKKKHMPTSGKEKVPPENKGVVLPFMGTKCDSQKFRGLPSHVGPKVRHVKRQSKMPGGKAQKNQKVQHGPNKPLSRKDKKSVLAMKPPAKKKKWSHDETRIKNLETNYHKKFEGNVTRTNKTKKKWFCE